MKSFEKGFQEKTLSLLAIEKEKGNEVLDIQFIKQRFGFSIPQMQQTRRKLIEKGHISACGRGGLKLVHMPKVSSSRGCPVLKRKGGRPYCPARGSIIGEKDVSYFCGVLKGITFCNGKPEIYYYPNCIGHVSRK